MSRIRSKLSSRSAANVRINKPFLKIGEVAKLLGLKPHILRYWEAEFPSLRPKKNPSGQRIYARTDIDAIVEIKNLLYNERYTISGAKKMLAGQERDRQRDSKSVENGNISETLGCRKGHLQELLVRVQSWAP